MNPDVPACPALSRLLCLLPRSPAPFPPPTEAAATQWACAWFLRTQRVLLQAHGPLGDVCCRRAYGFYVHASCVPSSLACFSCPAFALTHTLECTRHWAVEHEHLPVISPSVCTGSGCCVRTLAVEKITKRLFMMPAYLISSLTY